MVLMLATFFVKSNVAFLVYKIGSVKRSSKSITNILSEKPVRKENQSILM